MTWKTSLRSRSTIGPVRSALSGLQEAISNAAGAACIADILPDAALSGDVGVVDLIPFSDGSGQR